MNQLVPLKKKGCRSNLANDVRNAISGYLGNDFVETRRVEEVHRQKIEASVFALPTFADVDKVGMTEIAEKKLSIDSFDLLLRIIVIEEVRVEDL